VIHRDTVRARAWESAIQPQMFDPIEALIDVATRAETPEEGRRILRTFAEMFTETLGRQYRGVARQLLEERE